MAKYKRHAVPMRALRRRAPVRQPYDMVLIVCEGSKTEPNYLQELIEHHKLSSANVRITGEGGSAPISVVDYAIRLFEREPEYDGVYCVFDRDGHASFDQAVQRVRDKTLTRRSGKTAIGKAEFYAITSVPCFEYWILLHYKYTNAEMPQFADVLSHFHGVPELKSYSKGERGLYARMEQKTPVALRNADRANAAAKEAGFTNPTTRMPDLIRFLDDLAKRSSR